MGLHIMPSVYAIASDFHKCSLVISHDIAWISLGSEFRSVSMHMDKFVFDRIQVFLLRELDGKNLIALTGKELSRQPVHFRLPWAGLVITGKDFQ